MIFVAMCAFLTTTAQIPARQKVPMDSLFPMKIKLSAPVKPLQIINLVPNDFVARNYAFFCRNEWKLEKKIKFPVKFRLGDYETANKQEGKR